MEQINFFLADHAGEITAAFGVLAVILLFVTLHRIKRIEKYIQEMKGNVTKSTGTRENELRGANEDMAGVSDLQKPDSVQVQPAEELIDAVLDEVFS